LNGILAGVDSAAVTVYWGANSNAWANTNGLGNLPSCAFNVPVYGLTPGTVYYYECYGSNSSWTGWSGVASFTPAVASAAYYGGAYDGYDRYGRGCSLSGIPGTVIFVF